MACMRPLAAIVAVALLLAPAPRPAAAVTVETAQPQTSVQFTGDTTESPSNWQLVPPFIPLTDPRLVNTAPGCAPEQVRLTYWASKPKSASILVTYTTCDSLYNAQVAGPQQVPKAKPEVWVGTSSDGRMTRFRGVSTSYMMDWTPSGGAKYASPLIHHVLLKNLKPGQTYHYLIPDSVQAPAAAGPAAAGRRRALLDTVAAAAQPVPGANPFRGSFKVPSNTFPFTVAMWGDPGQLVNETLILASLEASSSDLFFIMGDIAYGDNFANDDFLQVPEACTGPEKACNLTCSPSPWSFSCLTTGSYGPRWDTWSRLTSPLLSKRPGLYTNGNHEIEPMPKGTSMWTFETRSINYNYRYPVPQTPSERTNGPKKLAPVTQQDRTKNMYYATEIAGVAKTIWLTSYVPQDDFSTQSDQYKFFLKELKSMDRRRTPWLVVLFHAPMYTSLTKHYKEVECMRNTYEPLMLKYGVDLALSGHNHAHEFILPVYNFTTGGKCNPTYIGLGGSCADDVTVGYIDQDRYVPGTKPNKYCATDNGGVNGTAFNSSLSIYQKAACPAWDVPIPGGKAAFCPDKQPDWSLYRESSYGHGEITFDSATQATWKWIKIGQTAPTYTTTITRHPSDCGVKA